MTIETIRKFYKNNPSFLGNREREILNNENATVKVWNGHKDCLQVTTGNDFFVLAWNMDNRKRGTVVN